MAAELIDGKALAARIQEGLTEEAARLRERGVYPTLSVVLVGDDPASHYYVRSKMRTAERLGIRSVDHILPATTSQETLMILIDRLNGDRGIHGILVQMPLPSPLQAGPVLEAIDPRKDVDGFHPFNVGRLVISGTPMPPCTPAGVMELIRSTGTELAGKEAVVVGRSLLVGRPVAQMLLAENMTVTMCHSRTRSLPEVCRRGDILVAAIGRPRIVTGEYIKEGAVVIDVGTTKVENRVVGDVDFEQARERAAAITPVPGGVGPMTITMLMKNTLTAARLASGP